MRKKEIVKRYIVFIIGLFINSLGVSMITKANLGTSPISSIPYVLSLHFPFTLGQFTIMFSILLIVFQLLILRKNFKFEHVLQIPVSIAFGYFIDFTMILLGFVNPNIYIMKIVYLLIGCAILGVGVYMEVLANVVMLPGESFVRAIVATWKTEFGVTKVAFDVSMTVIAGILSFIFMGQLVGVREGTIIAALLVGFIARFIGRKLSFLPEKLFPKETDTEKKEELISQKENSPICIAIGRQYGCGGHEIGKRLAKKLGFEFYDSEIIKMVANTTNYSETYIDKKDEKMTNCSVFDLINYMYEQYDKHENPKDEIFTAEVEAIQKLAQKGNCIIIGRCADYILKNQKNCLSIFLSAPIEYRIQEVAKRENISEQKAKKKIHQNDRLRANNYQYYTHQIWGVSSNYELCIDTSKGEEFVDNLIMKAVEEIKNSTENEKITMK